MKDIIAYTLRRANLSSTSEYSDGLLTFLQIGRIQRFHANEYPSTPGLGVTASSSALRISSSARSQSSSSEPN